MFHHHIIWSSKLIKRPSLQNIKKSKEIWRPGLCSSASIAQKQQQHVLPLTFFCHICMYIVLYTTTILDTIFLYWLFYSTGALGLYLTKLILKATHTGGSAFVSIDKRNCQSTLKKGFSTGSRCGLFWDPLLVLVEYRRPVLLLEVLTLKVNKQLLDVGFTLFT